MTQDHGWDLPEGGRPEPAPTWWEALSENLSRLHDVLRRERLPAESEVPFDPAQLAAAELVLLGAREPPWERVTSEEAETFRAVFGRSLREELDRAFGIEGVLGTSKPARSALLRLIEWDLRFLWHPSVALALRSAQVANDRAYLQEVGHALWQNRRCGARGIRAQRLLTRVLIQLRFGDRCAFEDLDYRRRVYEGLLRAFQDAEVPEDEPAMNLLSSPDNFGRHVRRLSEQ